MPKFSQPETAGRLYLSGVGGLFVLQTDEKRVVTLLQPGAGIWSEDYLREEIDGFLLRGRTQRLIAQTSMHWAPVHMTSAIPADDPDTPYRAAGAYAILDRYERSVQSLIEGRVHLENADLRNIMEGTIQGLIDIRDIGKRVHGNLKASNILLMDSADLSRAQVYLSDPAPDGALPLAAQAERKDLADLGRLLYELVNLRPYAEGTIGRSREWDRLGPNGEDWRKLCNALLDAAAPAEQRDLAKILARVKTWTLKPVKSRKPKIIAASILFLLVVGGPALWYFTRPPKLAFNQANWEKLCLSYAGWFRDFKDHFGDDKTRRAYSSPPYPIGVMEAFNKYADEFDKSSPQQIAASPTQTLDLAVAPTEDAKTGYGPNHTLKGVQLIDEVNTALLPANWKQLGNLDREAAAFEERGWKRPAEEIRSLVKLVHVPELPDPKDDIATRIKHLQPAAVYEAVDATVKASIAVGQIDARWNDIQTTIQRIPDTGVPLVNAFSKFADGFARSELDPAKPVSLADVTSLAGSFSQVENVANQLVEELTNKPGREIVYAELAKDPAAQVPAGGPTLELYGNLPAVAAGYVKLKSDPRESVEWKKSLADLDKETIAVIEEANPQDGNLAGLKAKHAELAATAETFLPQSPVYLPPIEKNSATISASVAAANDALKTLTDNAHQAVAPYIIDPQKYIAQQSARLTTSPVLKATPAVVAQWKKAHNALLAKLQANPAQIKNYRAYKAMDAKFNTLEADYLAFEGKIPTAVAGLSEIGGNDWRHTIAARVATVYRENALQDLMTNPALKWADDLPQIDDAAYVSYQKDRLSQFDKMRTDTLALMADYATAIDRLDHLYLNAGEPTAGAPTWRDLYAKWAGPGALHPLTTDPVIAGALQPFNDRLAALLAMDGMTAYGALVEKITAAPAPLPEIVLTAWRKLGAAAVDEGVPVLDDEDKAEAVLTGQINALFTAKTLTQSQMSAFTAEIAAQRPIRWRAWAQTLASAGAIQTALDKMESFKVTLVPASEPVMAYNKLLYDLRKDYDRNLKESELKQSAASFVAAVNALPAAASQDKDIVALLAAIEKPLKQPDAESSAAGAGPKLAGWEQDNSRPEVRLFYFPTKAAPKYVLEFAKMVVTQQGQQKTIWMCTTEMSVGLFADTVNASGKIADLDNGTKRGDAAHWFDMTNNPSYDPQGVRSWRVVDRKFAVNTKWLSQTVPAMEGKSHYPEGLEPPPPTVDDPMQALSPWSAMYGARLLGCRLPTSDEWLAAYAKFEATGPKDVWNLRGEAPPGKPSWKTQQDYSIKMIVNQITYPEQGAFLLPDLLFGASPVTAGAAKPWKADDLAKLAPARFTPGPDTYKGSTLWFRKVGTQPGAAPPGSGTGQMHDLVGNVAEYVFDGPNAIAIIKDATPTPAAVDAAMIAGRKNLGIIGGSSLSAPEMPFNKKMEVDYSAYAAVAGGFCDVGFRLTYTAPIDSIGDVLAAAFKDPKYLPGAKAKL